MKISIFNKKSIKFPAVYICFLPHKLVALQLGVLYQDTFTRILDFSEYDVELCITLEPKNVCSFGLLVIPNAFQECYNIVESQIQQQQKAKTRAEYLL